MVMAAFVSKKVMAPGQAMLIVVQCSSPLVVGAAVSDVLKDRAILELPSFRPSFLPSVSTFSVRPYGNT